MKTLKEYNDMEYEDLVVEFENTKNIAVTVDDMNCEIGVAFKEWYDYNKETKIDFIDSGYVFNASVKVGTTLGIELYWSDVNTIEEFIKELQSEYKTVELIKE